MAEKQRGMPKLRSGIVVGNKMDRTVVVEVKSKVKHSAYKKFIQRRQRYMAHDSSNDCRLGDFVEIISCRPLSKTKHWRVRKVLTRSGTD